MATATCVFAAFVLLTGAAFSRDYAIFVGIPKIFIYALTGVGGATALPLDLTIGSNLSDRARNSIFAATSIKHPTRTEKWPLTKFKKTAPQSTKLFS